MKTKYTLLGTFWVILYCFLVFTPLLILILGPGQVPRVPLQNISVGLAFIGLAIMGLQFALTARIKPIERPFGSDLVYHYHRQIGIAAFLMIFAHPILLFVLSTGYLSLLNIFTSPLRAKAGVLSLLLLVGVVWLAEFRSKLKIPYWFWKIWHGIIAILTMGLAIIHILLNGNYINLPWKQQLWIAYLVVWVLLLVYTRIIYPIKLMRNPYQVVRVTPERGSSSSLRLKSIKKSSFDFHPGQFAWLTAWKTPFSDTEHPFSLSSSAEHPEQIEMTIKKLGKFTTSIQEVKPGQQVYVDGAYGSFSCDRYPQATALVLIAGGIGITPLMSTLRTLADRGDKRPILLLYANRDWENVTFREELEPLKQKLNLKVVHILEQTPQNWSGETGFITPEILNRHIDSGMRQAEMHVFLCGPKPMMDAVGKHLLAVGIPPAKIHSEQFAF